MLKDYKFERKEFYNRRKRRDRKQKWLELDSLLATLFTVTSSSPQPTHEKLPQNENRDLSSVERLMGEERDVKMNETKFIRS